MEDYMKKLICHKQEQRDKLADRIIFILAVMIVIAGSITAVCGYYQIIAFI